MKKGYVFILVMMLGLFITGCSPVTSVKMDESGKGTMSYRMEIKKNAIEKSGITTVNNIDEFAKLLESKFAETLNYKTSVDTTSSDEFDYIYITTTYESAEDYNEKVKETLSQYNQLLYNENPFEDMFGYSSEMDANDYSCEYEALQQYMSDKGIEVDINNRNVRKFVKIMRPYEVFESSYVVDIDETEEEFKKLITKDSDDTDELDDFEERKYVQIVEDENGKTLNIDFMALNAMEMYIKKVFESKKTEIFNVEYVEENSKVVTKNGNIEVLKRTFETFDLASKIKNAIDTKNGTSATTYSMNEITPVMAVQIFDEATSKAFTEIYSKEYKKQEDEKENSENNYDVSFDDLENMYYERESQYEITYGGNTVNFTGDNIFESYNEDDYIAVNSKASNLKDSNNQYYKDLDNAPFTADTTSIILACIIAGIALSVALYCKFRFRCSSDD